MYFDWDESKNTVNIKKHGVDFRDAIDIFSHPMLTVVDEHCTYGEERWVAMGLMREMIGVVVYTERYEDVIRIISARKATKREVRLYEQNI